MLLKEKNVTQGDCFLFPFFVNSLRSINFYIVFLACRIRVAVCSYLAT